MNMITAEENAALYKEGSAINFVAQIKAQILIWQSQRFTFPLQPVLKFANQLKVLGKSYELHVGEGEGRGPQKTNSLVKQYRGVVSFLVNNLEGSRTPSITA